eukprot:gnl/MRDRNA2_/MRDRNA2_21719_c0_seq1.p1 gnl/MRDRNA2_/MRDRNA2_21719_c0~~gnl/MRDRNA2_/MRDRNA2_21719_c0_seq1.p1  ORF type:complete len:747 (+),score=95.59 gnl/MRDRNA2_/MRDRNA2_21719_c0_seq1:116-2242(+)
MSTQCTGRPLHLAVSQGWKHNEVQSYLEIIKLLLKAKAPMDAKVTRGGQDHYDVLHAAVFAEGRPASTEIVAFLLENKSDPGLKNTEQKTVLHIAYQTSSVDLIEYIQQWIVEHHSSRQDALEHLEILDASGRTPLKTGFDFGRLNFGKMAELAPLSASSAKTFLECEARCIPAFFARELESIKQVWRGEENPIHRENSAFRHCASWLNVSELEMCDYLHTSTSVAADVLVQSFGVDVKFIADLIHKDPVSASNVLDSLTHAPVCDNPGFHALPHRAGMKDYMKNCYGGAFRRAFNPNPDIFSFYVPSKIWEFNSRKFNYPHWHNRLGATSPPCVDIEVRVCYVPNLMQPETFAAITAADHLELFESSVIKGLVDQAWWQGAWRPDLLKGFINFWALVLMSISLFDPREGTIDCVGGFVGARGAVDFLDEIIEGIGYRKLTKHKEHGGYFSNFRNFSDIAVTLLFVAMLFKPKDAMLRGATVLVLWARLFGVFRCAEHIAVVLMPIHRSTYSVAPALFVNLMFFFALVQAFYVFNQGSSWENVMFDQFGLFFVADYPREQSPDHLTRIIMYLGLLVFTIGLLNIFICVISEAYYLEKRRVHLTLYSERANSILTFLLRAAVIPRVPNTPKMRVVVKIAVLLLIVIMALVQLIVMTARSEQVRTAAVPIFLLAILFLDFSVFQLSQGPWVTQNEEEAKKHYIWLAVSQN